MFQSGRSVTVLVAFALALFMATACSDKNVEKVKITTADAKTPKGAEARKGVFIKDEGDVAVGAGEEEEVVSVENLVRQTKQERFILAKPGETIRLFAEWSGIPVEELKLINDDKLPTFGKKYILSLTASEFSDFERKRQEYWTGRKKEMYDKYDIEAVEYVVKKNDTLDGISRKYDVPLWFLVMHNEACDPYHLSPGTKLIVPTLEEKSFDEAAAEGDETIPEQDSKEVFPVIVKKGETTGEYAKWGQISITDIKRANRHIKSIDRIRVGDTVNLPLTAKQFKRFQELRKKDARKRKKKKGK